MSITCPNYFLMIRLCILNLRPRRRLRLGIGCLMLMDLGWFGESGFWFKSSTRVFENIPSAVLKALQNPHIANQENYKLTPPQVYANILILLTYPDNPNPLTNPVQNNPASPPRLQLPVYLQKHILSRSPRSHPSGHRNSDNTHQQSPLHIRYLEYHA